MKKALEILKWIVLLSCIVVMWVFSVKQQKAMRFRTCEVNIKASENHFINSLMVNQILKDKAIYPIGEKMELARVAKIEEVLYCHPALKQVEVYSDIDGNLKVDLVQRNPILRVVGEQFSFYMDEEWKKMPMSDVFTSRTLVLSGNVRNNLEKDDNLHHLIQYIQQDAFWKSQIVQIYADKNNELILIPRVGNQEIMFGATTDIAEKFEKLKLFYKKGINTEGWRKYAQINLKYKNQIVCTKRN